MKITKKCFIGLLAAVFTVVAALSFVSFSAIAEDTEYKKSDVFSGAQFDSITENITIPDYCLTAAERALPVKPSGVRALTTASGAVLQYNNPINFSSLTKENKIVEISVLNEDDLAMMTALTVTFTDTEDPNNSFGVYYYKHSGNGAVYARVNYRGKSLGLGTDASSNGTLFNGNYGSYCASNEFAKKTNSDGSLGVNYPFTVAVDYAERQVYAIVAERALMILDLDEVNYVGSGFLWNGFADDKAYMSIKMEFGQAIQGGAIIKSILGNSLGGTFETEDDFDAPDFSFDINKEYEYNLPDAGVGKEYPVPDFSASDWYFGEYEKDKMKIEIQERTGEQWKTVADVTETLAFTPEKIGSYRVLYYAENKFKSTEDYMEFEVIEHLPPIVVLMQEEYETPEIGDSLYIPEISAYGGIGNVIYEESLYYNGKQITLPANRYIQVTESGVITLKVEARGYDNNPTTRYFPIEIDEQTVLKVNSMPKILPSTYTVVFPEAVAYDSATGEPKGIEITVDGVSLGNDRSYEVKKSSGTVKVVYSVVNSEEPKSKTFIIPVVNTFEAKPSDFMLTESGDPDLIDTNDSGLNFCAADTASVSWAFPSVIGNPGVNASVRISGLEGKSEFEYVDVFFADYYNESNRMFVRIYRECDAGDNVSYIQLNGEGTMYVIDGTLVNPESSVNFYIDTARNAIYSEKTNNPVLTFSDFDAQTAFVGFSLGGVTGEAGIAINQISNQPLNSIETEEWTDKFKPVIRYDKLYERLFTVNRGDKVILPFAEAFDMMSFGATVGLTVYAPDNTMVKKIDSVTESSFFMAEQLGTYRITYSSSDVNGRTGADLFICNVTDNVNPVLKIEREIEPKISAGTTVTIPKAIAEDNVEGECAVDIIIKSTSDLSYIKVNGGDEYKFEKAGTYKIIYITRDSDYNYTQYEMTVEVGSRI